MLLEFLQGFNWIDILVITLLLRICYVAIKKGLLSEFFKLLGTIAAIYLSLHYYTILSDWVGERLPVVKEKAPLEFLDFLMFLVLAILGYLIFVALRFTFYRFIKTEATPRLNQWGGFILGMARGFLLLGLVIYALVISSIGYLKTSVKNSYLGGRIIQLAPDTYAWLWNNIMSKFITSEKFNQTVIEAQEGLTKQ